MLMNEQAKLNRNHYMIFGLSWAGWVFDFYDLVLFTFLIAPIHRSLHLSPDMLSLCLGVSLFATGLGGIIFGALGDKYGRKKVLQWTIIIYSIGTFLCAFTWSFYSLVLFRFLTGLGVGGEWATGQIYINETFPDKLRAKYGAFMQSGAPVGVILASIVGGVITPIIGWRYTFLISIIPAIMVILIRRYLKESDVWIQNKDQYVNKNIFQEFKELISKEHRKIFLISLILCIFGMSAYWFTYSWLPTYLADERGLALIGSTIGIIIIQCGDFTGYTSFGYVAERLGRRPAFTIHDNSLLESDQCSSRFDIPIHVPYRIRYRILWRIRSIVLRVIPYKDKEHRCWNSVQPCTGNTIRHPSDHNHSGNLLRLKLWNSHCCNIRNACGNLDLDIP